MKIFGWQFLVLLGVAQLLGWLGFGKSDAFPALMVIVVPSAILSGTALFWAFYWNRPWVYLTPAVLVIVHVQVCYSSRYEPNSALLNHAMSQFLEKKVGGLEAYLGCGCLALGMLALTAAAAFFTAEIYRLRTGQKERGGMAFFREVDQLIESRHKKQLEKESDEA